MPVKEQVTSVQWPIQVLHQDNAFTDTQSKCPLKKVAAQTDMTENVPRAQTTTHAYDQHENSLQSALKHCV